MDKVWLSVPNAADFREQLIRETRSDILNKMLERHSGSRVIKMLVQRESIVKQLGEEFAQAGFVVKVSPKVAGQDTILELEVSLPIDTEATIEEPMTVTVSEDGFFEWNEIKTTI